MIDQIDYNLTYYSKFDPAELLKLWDNKDDHSIPNLIITGERGGAIINYNVQVGNLPKDIMKYFVISVQFDDRLTNKHLHPQGGVAQSYVFSIVCDGYTLAMYKPNELNFE